MPHAAHAELGATATLEVNATIVDGCWINNVSTGGPMGVLSSLDFGPYPQTTTGPLIAIGVQAQSITIRCTPGMKLKTQVNNGENYDDNSRRMQRGSEGDYINYTLCSDAACLSPISLGHEDCSFLDVTGPQTININFFASVNLSGTDPAGTYRDQVTISYIW